MSRGCSLEPAGNNWAPRGTLMCPASARWNPFGHLAKEISDCIDAFGRRLMVKVGGIQYLAGVRAEMG